MNRKKYLIQGGIYMILFQSLVGCIGFLLLYNNYDNITKSESIQEHYMATVKLSNHGVPPSLTGGYSSGNNMPGDSVYSGLIGNVIIGNKNIGSTSYQRKVISYQDINIKSTVHDAMDILVQQSSTITRDKRTSSYIIQQAKKDNFLQIVNDLNFLTKYTNNKSLDNPNQNTRSKLDLILQDEDSHKIIAYLKGLESKFIKLFMTRESKIGWNNNLLTSEKFAYTYNQLHVDVNNKYKDHITLAANIFNLNSNLIKACIFVEQLRAFYTFKGLFKSVAQTNTYLTVMSKQSFGIGGIKLKTAEELEKRLATNKPNIYIKYFAYENQNNITGQRLARLTDTKNYYYQILYTAGILYQYSTDRNKAGYDIINNPGLIATMYNIGYSMPHDNPDIGGSFMNIEGNRYSFGGLAMLVYYYLEIYG